MVVLVVPAIMILLRVALVRLWIFFNSGSKPVRFLNKYRHAQRKSLYYLDRDSLQIIIIRPFPNSRCPLLPPTPPQPHPASVNLHPAHRHGQICKKLNKSIFRSDQGRCFTSGSGQTCIFYTTIIQFEKGQCGNMKKLKQVCQNSQI